MPLLGEMACKIHGGLRPAGDIEFLKDIAEVIADGLLTEIQRDGNFLVRFAFRHQCENPAFLRREFLFLRFRG